MAGETKQRLAESALRLFGERGFAGTPVVDIERAAGLTGGTGALYRHFASKEELLVYSVWSCLNDWGPYAQFSAPDFSAAPYIEEHAPGASLVDKIVALCRLGMIRSDHIRDVRRILLRDNSVPRGVLDTFRREDHEIRAAMVARTFRDFASTAHPGQPVDTDWRPYAEVFVGAMAHLWTMHDIYSEAQPCGIDIEEYIHALATTVAAYIEKTGDR